MANEIRNILDYLSERISEAESNLSDLAKEKANIEERIKAAEQELQIIRSFYNVEAERLGIAPEVATTGPSSRTRFVGRWARDACHAVLRENKRMTKDEIVEALRKGGFDFEGKSPLRVVHFALIRDPHVRMHASGLCEWVSEESVTKTDAEKESAR